MKKKVLLSSILTIALCLTLIVGSTYALFTSGNDVNVAITAGKLEVVATINNGLVTRSLEDDDTVNRGGDFSNGGKAVLTNGELVISRMTPGDYVKFVIDVENKSDVALKYRVSATSAVALKADGVTPVEIDLSDALVITTKVLDGDVNEMNKDDKDFTSEWHDAAAGADITSIEVTVYFPNGTPDHDNEFKSTDLKTSGAKLVFSVFAVQANGVDPTTQELILPPQNP